MSIKKLLSGLVVVLVVGEIATMAAYAQRNTPGKAKFDLSKVTCRELLLMEGEEQDFTIVFYHGMMNGKNNDMMFDELALATSTDNIMNHCIDNPNDTVINAFTKFRSN